MQRLAEMDGRMKLRPHWSQFVS